MSWGFCDSHGHKVVTLYRFPGCRCTVPCQKTFECASANHEGDKRVPYCRGGDGELCDDCWVRENPNADSAE